MSLAISRPTPVRGLISVSDLRRIRKTFFCEWCHQRPGEQRHHCLIHDTKRFHLELTVEENLMLVCCYCHTGICVLDGYEVRRWFWELQCKRYGVDHMLKWVEGLPDKLKITRLDFM
jgi:hypothetical protein